MNTTHQDEITVAVIAAKMDYVKEKVDEIANKLEKDYVSRIEFIPVRNAVYGLIGLICTTVVGALLALVIVKPH